MVITQEENEKLFRYISDRNLLHQYDILQTDVSLAIETKRSGIKHETLRRLQYAATYYLCENPGAYRNGPIGITNTTHRPPDASEVFSLQDELVRYLNVNWDSYSLLHLAARTLWSICWIHPFEEGNGRTARAAAYYVICVKSGMWLPGRDIIPQQIRADRSPYYAALRSADDAYKNGKVDVSELETYLGNLLLKQLS
jgi:Fic family protein